MPINSDIKVPTGFLSAPPTFVGIGAQKAGTSWVHHCIMNHPDCYFPQFLSTQIDKQHKLKEHHFFDGFSSYDINEEDIHQYHRWCAKPVGKITGEWTPSYLSDPWVPRLLKQSAPNTKILVLLRDPVERYISGVSFSQRKNRHPDNQTETINVNTENYSQIKRRIASDHFYRGLYHSHLRRWRRYFDPSSILLIQYEQLIKNPSDQFKKVFRHIGLNDDYEIPHEIISQRFKHIPSAKKIPITTTQREVLIENYLDDVHALLKQESSIDISLWPNFREHFEF